MANKRAIKESTLIGLTKVGRMYAPLKEHPYTPRAVLSQKIIKITRRGN